MRWRDFLIGVILGLLVGGGVVGLFGNRYEVKDMGPTIQGTKLPDPMKIDKLTGRTWDMKGGQWVLISTVKTITTEELFDK